MADPQYFCYHNIFLEDTYPLSFTVRVALIQIFNFLLFFLIFFNNSAPTALMVPPRGVTFMTDP